MHRTAAEAKRLELRLAKLCEEQSRSQQRNQQLLNNFEEVEHHAVALAAKTHKLKTVKVLYVALVAATLGHDIL